METQEAIKRRFELLAPGLDERQRRLLAASEAMVLGRGGGVAVSQATGVSRRVIRAGIRELQAPESLPLGRVRRPGGGRKSAVEKDPELPAALERLIEPTTRGDPESPLRWTCKSLRKLTDALREQGHAVSQRVVANLLRTLEYSLQGNRKVLEGSQHPDRNAQFEYLNSQVEAQLAVGEPAISVDAKKKELVGPFKNGGRELRPKGQPEPVRVHDFVDKELGRATPYGVYDLAQNQGWVAVGIDHDTAEFAVASIARWWQSMGKATYPNATSLLITADGGGSNASRSRLWKLELQRFADESGLELRVCHLPPGTSKWNKIEHRLFSYITQNWRGKPLVSYEIIVQLIAATTTNRGLTVRCELDDATYETGRKVSDEELAAVNLHRDAFHGEWNYRIRPTLSPS
jgi:hypothetical protein